MNGAERLGVVRGAAALLQSALDDREMPDPSDMESRGGVRAKDRNSLSNENQSHRDLRSSVSSTERGTECENGSRKRLNVKNTVSPQVRVVQEVNALEEVTIEHHVAAPEGRVFYRNKIKKTAAKLQHNVGKKLTCVPLYNDKKEECGGFACFIMNPASFYGPVRNCRGFLCLFVQQCEEGQLIFGAGKQLLDSPMENGLVLQTDSVVLVAPQDVWALSNTRFASIARNIFSSTCSAVLTIVQGEQLPNQGSASFDIRSHVEPVVHAQNN